MTTRSEAIPLIIAEFEKEILLLERRQQGYEAELAEAVRAGIWSHTAGLDGRITGLLIAQNSLRETIKWLQVELNTRASVTYPVKAVPRVHRVRRKVHPIGESV